MEEGLSSDNINQIACVVDVQGFIVDKKFYPRELAIVNDIVNVSFNVDPEIQLQNTSKYQLGCLNFQTHQLHGLSIRPSDGTFNITNSTFKDFLYVMVKTLTNNEKPIIAIKNHQLRPILQRLNIDYVDVEKGDIIIPSTESLDNANPLGKWTCGLHSESGDINRKCALRKSCNVWSWLKRNQEKLRQIKIMSRMPLNYIN